MMDEQHDYRPLAKSNLCEILLILAFQQFQIGRNEIQVILGRREVVTTELLGESFTVMLHRLVNHDHMCDDGLAVLFGYEFVLGDDKHQIKGPC